MLATPTWPLSWKRYLSVALASYPATHETRAMKARLLTSIGAGLGVAGLLFALTGCSFSDSSASLSESIEGSSRSSSSSSPSSNDSAYRDDVRDYTVAYVRADSDRESFLRGVSQIAKRHGISS